MKLAILSIALVSALMLMSAPSRTDEARRFPPAQVAAGAELYAVNCSPCHGARMLDPSGAFNLRKFPPDAKERFLASVTKGKDQMPPWGDFFKPEQLDELWAYIMAGER